MSTYDALVLGGGPAGVSAALYLARASVSTAIVENGPGALAKARTITNYYGRSASGAELYRLGLKQARDAGVTLIQDEALSAEYLGYFSLALKNGPEPAECMALILAAGSPRLAPSVEGLAKFSGRGVSYCAVCDGFFFRGKSVAVLGCSAYAIHEALYLKCLAKSVTLLADGEKDLSPDASAFPVIRAPLKALEGDKALKRIVFADGSALDADGLFVALGSAGSADLARRLGARLNGPCIAVDASCATNVPGLFAAGDCTGGLLQIAKAVHEGAIAALAAVKYIRAKK